MDTRILELALETLENRKSAIDAEIAEIRAQLKQGDSIKPSAVAPAAPKMRRKSAAERKAHSLRMKEIWKRRKAEAATRMKPAATARPKMGPQSAAARKAQSERMKAIWAKRKAQAAKPKKPKSAKT
jgi:hypothetical protein